MDILPSQQETSDLVGLVYQGLLEPVPWSSILRWLNANFNASWSVLVLRPASPERPSLILQAHYQEVAVSSADYTLYDVYSNDPFAGLPRDRIITPEEFLGKKQWYGSDFFLNYLQAHDIAHEIGADFRTDDHADCRFRMCKPARAGAFTEQEKQLCELLLPHFRRAVYLYSRMFKADVEKKLFQSTFDRMRIATIILDEGGRLLTTNSLADSMLAGHAVLSVERKGLHCQDRISEARLQEAIGQALSGPDAPQITALSIPGGVEGELKVLVKRIPRAPQVGGSQRPAAAVFIHDPALRSAPRADILRALFHLTPAETALAQLLAEGLTLDEAGVQLGITRNTAKSRLRAIFEKTGTQRQASLVRVLLDVIVTLH